MNWLEFIKGIFDSLAWPIVVILLLFLLRHQLVELASRIQNIKIPGGTEVNFGEKLEAARDKEEVVKTEPAGDIKKAAIDDSQTNRYYFDMAQALPAGLVLESFKDVEKWLMQVNGAMGGARRSFRDIIDDLQGQGLVDKNFSDLYEQVRQLRNDAVHATGRQITPAEALEYRSLTQTIVARLESVFEKKIRS